jgi:hypothetical protein
MDDGCFNTHITKGSEDTQSNFSAIRNQDAFESHVGVAAEVTYEQSGQTGWKEMITSVFSLCGLPSFSVSYRALHRNVEGFMHIIR